MSTSTAITIANQRFEMQRFGSQLLLKCRRPSSTPLPLIGQAIVDAQSSVVADVIATECEIAIRLRDGLGESALAALVDIEVAATTPYRNFELPVCFREDADWPTITARTGMDRDSYIDRLTRLPLEVAMFGFLPGFVYLRGLPEEMHCPRKPQPEMTSANTLAIGGDYVGVYSVASPAGWQQVGTVGVDLLRPGLFPPLDLTPGDRLRCVAIGPEELERLRQAVVTLAEYNGCA